MARIFENSYRFVIAICTATGLIATYMRACGFAGWASFWRTIYVLPGHEHNHRLLRHEAQHLEQIERDGRLAFSIKYLWWLARYGYWNNPYEVEARTAESHSIDLSKMRQ